MKKEDDVKNGDVRRATFTVEGMDCADEVRLIEDKLGRLPGVENLQFDLMRRRLTIGGSITSSEAQRAIREIGMTARPEGEQAMPSTFWERRGRLVMTIISGVLLGLGLSLGWLGVDQWVTIPMLAASTFAGGWFIAPRGLQAVRNGALDMNFLFLVLALVGWATLWMAVASDMGASLLVIINGLRALKVGD